MLGLRALANVVTLPVRLAARVAGGGGDGDGDGDGGGTSGRHGGAAAEEEEDAGAWPVYTPAPPDSESGVRHAGLTPFPFESDHERGVAPARVPALPPQPPASSSSAAQDEGVDVLIHNVSHTDMLVDISVGASAGDGRAGRRTYDFSAPKGDAWARRGCVLARPKFSHYDNVSCAILRAIDAGGSCSSSANGGGDGGGDGSGSGKGDGSGAVPHPAIICRDSDVYTRVPCGFDLSGAPVTLPGWGALHLRSLKGDDIRAEMEATETPLAVAVYFPLISVVLPKWLREASEAHPRSRKVVYLVSGCGAPRDITQAEEANSTLRAAQAMRRLLDAAYGHLVSFHIVDSGSGVFHYGANVRFVSRELSPRLAEHRRRLALEFGEGWGDVMNVTLSLCDGPPARMAALSAGLRWYKPSTLHMWQLKSFWHEGSMLEEVVHMQSFAQAEGTPSTPVASHTNAAVRALVAEMVKFRDTFIQSLGSGKQEMSSFWMRKTKKPVLAVLMVRGKREGDPPVFYRGVNLEVSMPTGSLCSERNVIGTALAADPALQRQDLLMIAVLSLSLFAHMKDKQAAYGDFVADASGSEVAASAANGSALGACPPHTTASAPTSPFRGGVLRPPRRPKDATQRCARAANDGLTALRADATGSDTLFRARAHLSQATHSRGRLLRGFGIFAGVGRHPPGGLAAAWQRQPS